MTSEKQKFANRLNLSLDDAGYPKIGQGRQSALASVLDEPAHQIGKWLKGEDYPKTSKLVKLAQHLGVRSNWLLSGVGEKYTKEDEAEKEVLVKTKTTEKSSGLGQTALTQDAFDLALVWMKLPLNQRKALQNLIHEMVKDQ